MSLLNSLIQPVSKILDKAIPDQDLKRKLSHEIATMSEKHAQELALAQINVNAAEAASGSFFKGGWRPCIGWICGIAFGYHFVLQPVIIFEYGLGAADFYNSSPLEFFEFLEKHNYCIYTLHNFIENLVFLTKEEFTSLYTSNQEYYFLATFKA